MNVLSVPKGSFELSGGALAEIRPDRSHPPALVQVPLTFSRTALAPCLAYVNRFTLRPEATPQPDVAAPTVVQAFLSGWVATFVVLSTITADRDAQFESHFFQCLLSFLDNTHPAANVMVERFHCQLETPLRAADDPGNWMDHLPLLLLGTRSAPRSDLSCPAAQLVFGPIA
ncbi:hypothetical protein SprV_0200740600 [Sparganum proliferum]